MLLTRLYLRNYRVYEDELELELPAGLVGIYGANGAGKSALIEAIRFCLYGQARTSKDEIRTSDVKGDCITEVEFEHEGHLYLVRRTITGANHTVKAEAHWNNQQVAEGVRDVGAYVHSVLGMDDTSFRASVYAEQKQIAAFSSHGPQKRRDLVLRLLGITPLDKARDAARADAREARADHERLANRLPDLAALEVTLAEATAEQGEAAELATNADDALATAAATAAAAEEALDALDDLARTYDALVLEGKAAAKAITDADERLVSLRDEQAALTEADARLAELRTQAEGIDALEALAAAQATVEALPSLEAPVEPDPTPATHAKEAADAAAAAAAELGGALRGAEQELARAEASAARSAELSPEEDCPVCGQSLGDAFEQVVAHRTAEVEAARARITELRTQHTAASAEAKTTATAATEAAAALATAQQAWTTWQHHAARRTEVETALATARTHPFFVAFPVPETAEATKSELAARKQAATEVAKLEARLERAPRLVADIDALTARVEQATAEREQLLDKVKALAFTPADHQAAKTARQAAREALKATGEQTNAARQRAATAQAAVAAAEARLADGKALHADLADLAERSRHLGRLGDLLADFRNNVVATVGPRLAAQAAELFAELTDHEYDQLEVDPETYDIKIRDGGRAYGMDRFSGSEVDLANLALRVAISEHVRFQSGGTVGLLVLDEVFGPLDDERKERMLLALERLKGRFRQVLVVTHDSAIKEQLPNAIQVDKLPGRRARAHLLVGGA
jgi:exonuclease SbcC